MISITNMIADLGIAPGQSPVFDNPNNYDLAYEDVTFKASDGVTLSGWLVNPGCKKVMVLTHFGVYCSRTGFTRDGKGWAVRRSWHDDVRFLKTAKAFAGAGYTTLMYDLRNHGNSGKGTNEWICDGQEEYKDVLAAIEFITGHADYSSAPIGLLSLCMGSSSTLRAYGIPGGLQECENIRSLIMVQPLYNKVWFQAMHVPKLLINGAAKASIERGGVDFRLSPIAHTSAVNVPTMVVQNRNDPMAWMDYVNDVYDQLKVEKVMEWRDLKKSRMAGYADITEHPEVLLNWFDRFV